MDNLGVHRSKRIQDAMEELGVEWIYNAGYSPDYNPAERAIGLVKGHVKKRRLKAIIRDEKPDIRDLIVEGFE